MNGIILYGSQYGASRQYAEALEIRTGLPAVSYDEIRDFGPFDTIVYVGGLYAGKVTGLAQTLKRLPTDHPFRFLVATVGLADGSEENLKNIREGLVKTLTPAIFARTAHVHLRGALDYRLLSRKHHLMMQALCSLLRRKPVNERTWQDQAILDSYGQALDFMDFDGLLPIQAWLET